MKKNIVLFLKILFPIVILIIPFLLFKVTITTLIKQHITTSVILNLIITTLITGYYKLIFDKMKIEFEVSKQVDFELKSEPIKNRLAEYESDLNKSKDVYLKEYEKNITGFNKLLDKRYETYPLTYSKFIYIHGELNEWIVTESLPTFSEYNEQEIINFLNTYELGEIFNRKFLEKWKASDPNLESFFTEHIYKHFNRLRMKGLNYFNNNRIFFSKEVEVLSDKIMSLYSSIINDLYYHHSAHNRVYKYDDLEKKLLKTQNIIVDLKNKIRSELSKPNCKILE